MNKPKITFKNTGTRRNITTWHIYLGGQYHGNMTRHARQDRGRRHRTVRWETYFNSAHAPIAIPAKSSANDAKRLVRAAVAMFAEHGATLRAVLDAHARFKSSYFWTPPSSASGRRRMAADNSRDLNFEYDGRTYSVCQDVGCSCRNVYYKLAVTVDGDRKDVRAIKRLRGGA